MHSRHWTRRCLARHPETGTWCTERPTDGVFCAAHGLEFRHDEAAKAATRLARARLALRDPSTTTWERWRAGFLARRARTLRRALLDAVVSTEDARSDRQFVVPGFVAADDDRGSG